jgi:NAD(P)-dependent dehydrogenase (short-subunit alcohol dehydrogenase family)
MIADFAHLSDVKKVAQNLLDSNRTIDVLIHNAGVYLTKKNFTEDEIETVFQVNFLGSFILNYMLKEKLKAQKTAKILLVNSEGHRFALAGVHLDDLKWKKHGYSGLKSYGAAKSAQLLTMMIFNDYFKDSGVSINAMHPGDVKTNMGENNGRFYRFFKHHFVNPSSKSPEISAKALYYLGVSSEMNGISGKFFNLTTEEEPAPHALDREAAEKIWTVSLQLGGFQ